MLSHQGILIKQLKSIFPDEKTQVNVRKEVQMKYHERGLFMELDAWIPKLKIGFEFQDEYHYMSTGYSHLTVNHIQKRDKVKSEAVKKKGISLVIVPVWWDGSQSSLAATIHFQRPELAPGARDLPVPLNPSTHYFTDDGVPGVGELMLASFPIDSKFRVTANRWWMGEKYDGFRYCWNPNCHRAYTRSGRSLQLLPEIISQMPPIFLDGEFWFGRGNYSLTADLFRGYLDLVLWHALRMLSFDTPEVEKLTIPYENRFKWLLKNVFADHPFIIPVTRVLCANNRNLNWMVQSIISDQGEGVILQRINSPYDRGRSPALMKLKSTYGDREGIVVKKDENEVTLSLPTGKTFAVPWNDVRVPTLSLGDIVTFSFEGNVRGDIPVSPKIYRIRTDVLWDDVMQNSGFTHSEGSEVTNQVSRKEIRQFMEEFAKNRNLDPLAAETWYGLAGKGFKQFKKSNPSISNLKCNYKLLQRVFPEIKFSATSFPESIWDKVENRRKFFENYAKDNGFDPQDAYSWYIQPREKILSYQGAANVLRRHSKNIRQALIDLFPNIGLDKPHFWDKVHEAVNWHEPNRRREFFENFAKQNGFNPLRAEKWYPFLTSILTEKGANHVIYFHRKSVGQALLDLFPNIGLDKSKLTDLPSDFGSWHTIESRRQFLEEYARSQGFDPQNPEPWYLQNKQKILSVKGGSTVLGYHGDSLLRALTDLFPKMEFDTVRFPSYRWANVENRRKFFLNYAKTKGFDPLVASNWYTQPTMDVLAVKGASRIFIFHGRNLPQALDELFPEWKLDKSQFKKYVRKKIPIKRQLLEKYAKQNGFDPLVPENWYSRSISDILAFQNVNRLVSKRSLPHMLADVFPDIGLNKSKFIIRKKSCQ